MKHLRKITPEEIKNGAVMGPLLGWVVAALVLGAGLLLIAINAPILFAATIGILVAFALFMYLWFEVVPRLWNKLIDWLVID